MDMGNKGWREHPELEAKERLVSMDFCNSGGRLQRVLYSLSIYSSPSVKTSST